jgi:hypothetical protein
MVDPNTLPKVFIDLPAISTGICSSPIENCFYIACENHALYRLDGTTHSVSRYAGIADESGNYTIHNEGEVRMNGHRLNQLLTSRFGPDFS